MFFRLIILAFLLHHSLQTFPELTSRRVYITQRTCGTKIMLRETESLYLDYFGNVLNFNVSDRLERVPCIIDIETLEGAEQTCIETDQTHLREGCKFRFTWHSGSRDFMLYGLSTYWCDMFSHGSVCMPVWRSRLMLDASQRSSIRIHFSTQRKAPIKAIHEQPKHMNDKKQFAFGLRGRLSLDFYIILAVLVFICACAAIMGVMRHMKNRANRRRILSTNIELAQINQTLARAHTIVHHNYADSSCFNPHPPSNHNQQRFYPQVQSATGTKYATSYSGYICDIGQPPPYLENPPAYNNCTR